MSRLVQFLYSVVLMSIMAVGLAQAAKASVCNDIIFKGCLLDGLVQINSQATHVDDESSNDFIIRLNTRLLLHLLDGNPDSGIRVLNQIDDAPFRNYLAVAVVRALEMDGHITEAYAVLSSITNPADRASARAYRALVRADYRSATGPALVALKYGEIGPIIGVLALTPSTRTNMYCDEAPELSRKCLALFIRRTVADENDKSVIGLGNALAYAIEGRNVAVINTIRSFSDKEVKTKIALGAQRAYAVMGKAKLADNLVKYTKRVEPVYLLDKAIWAGDMTSAYGAMKKAVQDGSLHAFLDVYQDVPAYPESAEDN